MRPRVSAQGVVGVDRHRVRDAREHIFGYTVHVDVSDRSGQRSTGLELSLNGRITDQWLITASFAADAESGGGKSRLLAEFGAGLAEQARWLTGRCLPYGEGITYWPVAEIEGLDEARQTVIFSANRDNPGERRIYAVSYAKPGEPKALTPAGGSLPHNNLQPYLTLNYCIALQGVFPARP